MAAARYAPYSAAMVGPLPYLRPAAPRRAEPEATPEPELPPGPEIEPDVAEVIVPTAPAIDTPDVVIEAEPAPTPPTEGAGIVLVIGEPEVSPAPVADLVPSAPAIDTPDVLIEAEPAPTPPTEGAGIESVIGEPEVSPWPVAELVLTPSEDAPEPTLVRALWTPEQRAEPASAAEAGLFGEDLSLTQGGGPILRHEDEQEQPVRFDWSETGAFIIMGGVGLTAFGASMAAFRLASEQAGGGDETTMIAWVLAVIGAACVGVSSFNLYRRWGLPGGD
jgi:hypothetical protein